VERFAALPLDGTTTQVERLFAEALADAVPGDSRLQTLQPHEGAAYAADQRTLRRWLAWLRALDPDAPRLFDRRAHTLRERANRELARLDFITSAQFAPRGAELRLFPRLFGVNAAVYFVIAAALAKKPALRVSACAESGCAGFVLHVVGRGRPRHHCFFHSAQRKKRKKVPQ
jgi:hypothetical protein